MIALLLLGVLMTPCAVLAPQAAAPGGEPSPARADEDPIMPPPMLSPAGRQKLLRAIKALRTQHAPARAEAQARVVAFGRGAIPPLVDATSTVHANKREAILSCLLTVADHNDRELVARCATHEREVLRRFAVIMAGSLALPELLDLLPARLEDSSEAVRVEAALSLVANGDEAGLPTLLVRFASPLRGRILAVLPGLRDRGPHHALLDRLVVDPVRERRDPAGAGQERIAATQMLGVIGDEAAIHGLTQALDDAHNVVQREAIDALRRLLEHQPPFQGRSIFQQLREVERLRQVLAVRRSEAARRGVRTRSGP